MAEKRYYMACVDLEGREVLVVGGGSVAREKIDGLLDVGALSPSSRPRSRAGRGARPGGTRRARSWRLSLLRPRGTLPRRGRDVGHVGERARLRRCRGAGDALQRRRRARALQLHPPGRAPRRSDRRRDLDRRCVARAGPAAARRRRTHRHRRPRRTRARAPRPPSVGEGAPPDLRRPAGLLPGPRRGRLG